MALLNRSRSAQYSLVQEFIFNFGDTMVDNSGVTKDFKSVDTPTFKVFTLPVGAVVSNGDLIVETAWVGPTVATVALGDAASGGAGRYLAATSLLATGRTALIIPFTGLSIGADALATFSFTVAAATAGRARLRIHYTIEGRANEPQTT